MADVAALEREMQAFRDGLDLLERSIATAVVGQKAVVEQTLCALVAGGHVLFEGAPGLGKTLLVRTLAEAVDLSFSRVQFTPDLMPADVTGTNVVVEEPGGGRRFRFQKGPIFANLVLADEINRTTPKTQSALLEAMQEGAVTVAGESHRLPDPFMVLATQNPIEMEGTYPLPEAQLDRFLLKVLVPFPSADELAEVLDRTTGPAVPSPARVLGAGQIAAFRALAKDVVTAPQVRDAAVKLVLATHPDRPGAPEIVRRYVRYGSSPRGAQALVACGKVRALRRGRPHLAVEDVLAVAPACLRHRIILNFEGEAEGVTTDRVLEAAFAAAR
ncbi:MAG TPA: AAA family ATPase [Planctomycetota bacterium]|nr:AAA family ATPase [Planctomycetota bacterium]